MKALIASIDGVIIEAIGAALMARIGNASWTWLVSGRRLLSVMPYVIAQPCIGVKDRACVEVCPMDCIGGNDDSPQLYINPDDCIDCNACAAQCPVGAIFPDVDLPLEWRKYEKINADFFE